ncbi:hypothetical protein C1645_823261, partial [Glomus cerebriforme]
VKLEYLHAISNKDIDQFTQQPLSNKSNNNDAINILKVDKALVRTANITLKIEEKLHQSKNLTLG